MFAQTLVQSREAELLRMFERFAKSNLRPNRTDSRPRLPQPETRIVLPNKLPKCSREGVYCHFCKKLLYFEGRSYKTQKCESHTKLLGGIYVLSSCESCATLYMTKKNGSEWICALCAKQSSHEERIQIESQLQESFHKYVGVHLQPYIVDDLIELIRQYIY